MNLLEILASQKASLKEMLDSKNPATWSKNEDGYHGIFKVGGEEYEIILSELHEDILSTDGTEEIFVEFGFKYDDSVDLTNKGVAFSVFGSILYNLSEKLPEIKPDYLIFAVADDAQQRDKRKKVYDKLASRGMHYGHLGFQASTDWTKAAKAEIKVLSKRTLTVEQKEKVSSLSVK